MISIWFFIGVLLLVYGVLILGAGIYECVVRRPQPWCWPNLHAAHLVGRAADRARRDSTRSASRPERKSEIRLANDFRRDRRQPRLLPGPSGAKRPRGDDRRARERRLRSRRARSRRNRSTARSNRAPKRKRCADLFKKHRDEIDGVIVTLPNFGDERAIADTLRLAGLNVPVLVQATPDTPGQMTIARPPRQLLRQDVGLQQSHAVRHSVFADHAAHRSARFRDFREGSRLVRRRLPRRATACGVCASAPSARGPPRSTPSATARKFSKPTASRSSPSTSPKSSAASSA